MQTFLPYAEFKNTVKCLDYRRLGRQRVEAKQILNVLQGKTTAWANHPAVKMWRGFEEALKLYHNTCILEWINRGYTNNMPLAIMREYNLKYPRFLGLKEFHESHQSNLLRKDFAYYSQFNWNVKTNLSYYWPKEEGENENE